MIARVLFLFGALVAVALIPRHVEAAATHEGKVTAVTDGKISILESDGDSFEFNVAADAKIILNGKPAKLSDIEVGDVAQLTVESRGGKKVVVSIVARDPE